MDSRGDAARVIEKAERRRVEGPTRFQRPSGVVTYPRDTMVLKLGAGANRPARSAVVTTRFAMPRWRGFFAIFRLW
jgi:hypothetical protein